MLPPNDCRAKEKKIMIKKKNRETCKKYREEQKKEIAIKSKEKYKKKYKIRWGDSYRI